MSTDTEISMAIDSITTPTAYICIHNIYYCMNFRFSVTNILQLLVIFTKMQIDRIQHAMQFSIRFCSIIYYV